MHNSDGGPRMIELILLYSKNQAVQLHVDQQQQQRWSTDQNTNILLERSFEKL